MVIFEGWKVKIPDLLCSAVTISTGLPMGMHISLGDNVWETYGAVLCWHLYKILVNGHFP